MNINSVSGCPERGHSISCWDEIKESGVGRIDPEDPSACGTCLVKEEKTAKALSAMHFQQDKEALLLIPPFLKRESRRDPSTFLTDTDPADPAPLPKLNPSPDLSRPIRRPLRVLLVGERQDVLATIKNLHKRGFADAGDWSIPLPYPQQHAVSQFIPRGAHIVISVHTKYMS